MDRVVYCPSIKKIEEATKISQETQLPIQIGDSEKTKDLIFDKKVVQVLEIPQINELFSFGEVQQFFHQCVIYVDEFLVLKNNTKLIINQELVKPNFEEKHRVKYSYYCVNPGVNSATIYHKDKVIKEFDFVVHRKV